MLREAKCCRVFKHLGYQAIRARPYLPIVIQRARVCVQSITSLPYDGRVTRRTQLVFDLPLLSSLLNNLTAHRWRYLDKPFTSTTSTYRCKPRETVHAIMVRRQIQARRCGLSPASVRRTLTPFPLIGNHHSFCAPARSITHLHIYVGEIRIAQVDERMIGRLSILLWGM